MKVHLKCVWRRVKLFSKARTCAAHLWDEMPFPSDLMESSLLKPCSFQGSVLGMVIRDFCSRGWDAPGGFLRSAFPPLSSLHFPGSVQCVCLNGWIWGEAHDRQGCSEGESAGMLVFNWSLVGGSMRWDCYDTFQNVTIGKWGGFIKVGVNMEQQLSNSAWNNSYRPSKKSRVIKIYIVQPSFSVGTFPREAIILLWKI